MPKEYAIKRIKEAKALGVPHIVFTGGEPTLHPDFLEIFREVEKLGMTSLLITNGIPIREEILKEFTESPRTFLYFSLDCHNKEINDKYRDKNSFDYVINTIKKVRSFDPNKFIGINSILVKETLEHLPKTADFVLEELKANSLNVERVIRVGSSEKMPDEWIINDMNEYFKIINQIFQKHKTKFRSYTCDIKSCLLDNKNSFNILIFPDKNIYLCCNLPDKSLKIGSEKESLDQVLEEKNIKKIANLFNEEFFKNQDQVRKEKGIFGCIECVEEYKKLRDKNLL
jgi:MoaA/NifB/PqqE/SkfB family radical SAM enzyme